MTRRPVVELVSELLAGPRPLRIVQAGDPVLRRPAEPFDGQLDDALLAELVDAMRTTMHEAPGVGLAAPQVGVPLAVAVVEDMWGLEEADDPRERRPLPFRVLVNPSYTPATTERVAFWEGCLSVSGWQAVTPRWRSVHLTGQDQAGAPVDEVLTGWPARIVQHETDHLRGRLYVDGAELRSLCSGDEAARWSGVGPDVVARELGFEHPPR